MPIHTAAAQEDEDGRIVVEGCRVHDNASPFFPLNTENPCMPDPDTKADYVRWFIDPTKPDRARLPDSRVILDVPSEFPRVDERFMSHRYNFLWMNVFIPAKSDGSKNSFHGLNGLAMHSHDTGKTRWLYAGDDSQILLEPIFVPRTTDAPEGDGWVIALVERHGAASRCDLVVLNTRSFETPVAIVQLPFHVKAQIRGNWVSDEQLGGYKPVIAPIGDVKISDKGALEPL